MHRLRPIWSCKRQKHTSQITGIHRCAGPKLILVSKIAGFEFVHIGDTKEMEKKYVCLI